MHSEKFSYYLVEDYFLFTNQFIISVNLVFIWIILDFTVILLTWALNYLNFYWPYFQFSMNIFKYIFWLKNNLPLSTVIFNFFISFCLLLWIIFSTKCKKKSLGNHLPVIQTVKDNLLRFIDYKKRMKSWTFYAWDIPNLYINKIMVKRTFWIFYKWFLNLSNFF